MSEQAQPEVIINGVRYVPAATDAPGVADVLRTLALQYHTPDTLESYGMAGLRVIVGEFSADEGGETFDELAVRLATPTR